MELTGDIERLKTNLKGDDDRQWHKIVRSRRGAVSEQTYNKNV